MLGISIRMSNTFWTSSQTAIFSNNRPNSGYSCCEYLPTISELWSENGANSPSQYGVGHKIREFLVRIELGVQLFLGEHIESYAQMHYGTLTVTYVSLIRWGFVVHGHSK